MARHHRHRTVVHRIRSNRSRVHRLVLERPVACQRFCRAAPRATDPGRTRDLDEPSLASPSVVAFTNVREHHIPIANVAARTADTRTRFTANQDLGPPIERSGTWPTSGDMYRSMYRFMY